MKIDIEVAIVFMEVVTLIVGVMIGRGIEKHGNDKGDTKK